ncbi:hypothetical protein VXS05_18355 [Photobacterium toruni]|uniref:hypothetical protein n=1 Tax=Photobacterium toruni TaxID=1935446 RepID=UPI002E1853CC|nr:hypothetical protein [Photobacterium toruni]
MNKELRTKWLMYTVFIGLLPVLLRFLLVSLGVRIPLFSIGDFIAFGLVLHISILNEIEHVEEQNSWKTKQNAFSFMAIFIYGAFYCLLMIHESGFNQFNIEALKNISIISAMVSLIISFSVFYRPNKMQGEVVCI